MKILILILSVFVLTACPGKKKPPTPESNVCDPVTQPSPHYATKGGKCLPSCGAAGGTHSSFTVSCEQSGHVTAGEAYDITYCCKRAATPTPMPSIEPSVAPSQPPSRAKLLYGYYFEDGRYGNFRSEVACYTNTYLAWARRQYELSTDDTDDVWLPRMKDGMQAAFNKGRRIYLSLNLQDEGERQTPIDRVLDIAKPFWANVDIIELADEPGWNRGETEARIRDLKAKLQAKGLKHKPMGIVYTQDQTLNQEAIFASNADWVGLEAYVDPPGSDDPKVNVDKLNNFLKKAKARVPAEKELVIVMQAYSRNYGWKNIDTLKVLQEPAYLAAKNDPRVLALMMFSYGRPSGSREYPLLKEKQRKFGNEILGKACQ